jgi:hypothetical protein
VRVGSSGSARLAARAALPLLTTRRTTRPSAPSTTTADVGNGEWEPLDSEPSGGPRHTSPGDAPRSGPRRGRGRPQGSGTHRGAAVGQRSRRRPDSRTGGHRPRLAAEGPPTTPRIRSSILCAGFSTRNFPLRAHFLPRPGSRMPRTRLVSDVFRTPNRVRTTVQWTRSGSTASSEPMRSARPRGTTCPSRTLCWPLLAPLLNALRISPASKSPGVCEPTRSNSSCSPNRVAASFAKPASARLLCKPVPVCVADEGA